MPRFYICFLTLIILKYIKNCQRMVYIYKKKPNTIKVNPFHNWELGKFSVH